MDISEPQQEPISLSLLPPRAAGARRCTAGASIFSGPWATAGVQHLSHGEMLLVLSTSNGAHTEPRAGLGILVSAPFALAIFTSARLQSRESSSTVALISGLGGPTSEPAVLQTSAPCWVSRWKREPRVSSEGRAEGNNITCLSCRGHKGHAMDRQTRQVSLQGGTEDANRKVSRAGSLSKHCIQRSPLAYTQDSLGSNRSTQPAERWQGTCLSKGGKRCQATLARGWSCSGPSGIWERYLTASK